MTRSVEEIYSGSSCVGSLGLNDVSVALGPCAPVEINDLHGNANGFDKNLDEQSHTNMIDLGVHGFDDILAISFNSIVFHDKTLKCSKVRFKVGTCQ